MTDVRKKGGSLPRLFTLQAGRGLAALAIIFYHVATILRQKEYGAHSTFHGAEFGIIGLNFFFVLSGFIVLMAHFKDIGNPFEGKRFLFRRILRIYPVYWIFLTAYIGAAAVGFGHPDFSWDFGTFFNAYSLFYFMESGSADPLPLKVAWILFFEIQFYLFFLLLVFNKKVGILALAGWFGAIVFLNFPEQRHFGFSFTATFFSLWNIHFLFGMAAYLAYRKIPDKYWSFFIALGGALIAWFVYLRMGDTSGSSIHGLQNKMIPELALGFALIILGFVMAERAGKLKVPAFLTFLGDASYSIYLIHSAFISAAVGILNKLGALGYLGAKPVYFILVISAAMVGCIGYVLIEKPLLARLSKIKGATKR